MENSEHRSGSTASTGRYGVLRRAATDSSFFQFDRSGTVLLLLRNYYITHYFCRFVTICFKSGYDSGLNRI